MMEIQELQINDIKEDLLKYFNRYQETNKTYKKVNGKWILTDEPYKGDWNDVEKMKVIDELLISIKKGDYVFGVYDNNKLIAFSNLINEKFGTKNQYIRIDYLHVSYEYRNKGIGKKLFEKCINKAREIGVKKIYIPVNYSEDAQEFYKKMGCVDAEEINKDISENEPKSRQMEYVV